MSTKIKALVAVFGGTMKGLSGVKAGPLPQLRSVLDRWIYTNEEYLKRCEGKDAAWWFNERSALSTLAGAAWLANGIALEEYTTSKTQLPDTGKSTVSNRCRCDLFLSVKRRQRGFHHDFIAEAKLIWPSLVARNLEDQIWRGIDKVRRDVRRTHNDGFSRRIGILQISPWISRSFMDDFRDYADRFVKLLRGLDGVAVAWVFSPNPKKLKSDRTDWYFPGTALVISPLRKTVR